MDDLQGPPGEDTYFAPAPRATSEEVRALSERALSDPIIGVVFEAIHGYAMIIDEHRQIVAANSKLLELLGVERDASLLGLRPGEALGCINASRGPGGCGTSIQCRHCGAVSAILAAQVKDEPVDGYCTVACCSHEQLKTLELRVRATPLTLGDDRVYVFVFHDVTAAKRRELFERMFLHDLGNLVTGLVGWSDELVRSPAVDAAPQIIALIERVREQLEEQTFLARCESGEMTVAPEPVRIEAVIESLRGWFQAHECAIGRQMSIVLATRTYPLSTDRILLLRVLGNLLKNAFEASQPGGTVTLRVDSNQDRCIFEVENAGILPADVMHRIFKERFSTKGTGRGLGTYAAQLFGEQCLGGKLSLESSTERGTRFRFELPNVAPRSNGSKLPL